jgi:tRNA modification GTPase
VSPSERFPGFTTVALSALTGAGLDTLTTAITAYADSFQNDTGNDLIAINARHAHALTQARECLAAAQTKLADGTAVELLASDLRDVLAAYGEIAGKVDNERMLDALFATFCIGK